MTTEKDTSVWLDKGDPDCEGEVRWTQDASGRRTFTCPDCSLHWYYDVPRNPPGVTTSGERP